MTLQQGLVPTDSTLNETPAVKRQQIPIWLSRTGDGPTKQHYLRWSTAILGLAVGWGSPAMGAVTQPIVSESSIALTSSLNQKARQAYDSGQYWEAFQQWQAAIDQDAHHLPPDQLSEITVNQGLALQQLGQLHQACMKFASVLELASQVCEMRSSTSSPTIPANVSIESPEQFFSALFLSQTLWSLGTPTAASTLIEQAVQRSTTFGQGRYAPLAQLERIGLQHRFCKQGLDQSLLLDDITLQSQLLNQTLTACQQVFENYLVLLQHEDIKFQAQVQWLDLYLTLLQWNEQLGRESPPVQRLLEPYKAEALDIWAQALMESQPAQSPAQIELELRLIQQGLQLYRVKKSPFAQSYAFVPKAFERSRVVLAQTQKADNPKIEAIAYQLLGDLYTETRQWEQAEFAYRYARNSAEQIDQWELTAQIYQSLAKIQLQRGQPVNAIASYEQAIQRLNRPYLTTVNPLNFSFQERVESVHHEYMQLLLQQPNPDYGKVVAANDQLRVKELINYLRCGALEVESLANLPQERTPTHFIHILQLDQQFHVVVQLSSGDYEHYQPDSGQVQQTLTRLLLNLKSDTLATSNERSIQRLAKSLYDELLGPIAPKLQRNSTLVFSLDSSLHGLPMALLYDGQQYLFENFQLSTNFGLRVPTPQKNTAPLENVLIAGLSTVSPSFQQLAVDQRPPLLNVRQEAQSIAQLANKSDILLNQTFTLEQLQQRLYRQNFPSVHIATHGSFSSNPEDTYLLAWDQKIQLPDFERLLQTLTQQGQSLALLVLSACETAQGDRRAALGLAGLATQSGAQTTVASLWKVDDKAAAVFMTAFYRALADGQPKAKALRQAQRELRASDEYNAPYYWAPFILLGHWR